MSDYQWQPQPERPQKPRKQRSGWRVVLLLLIGGFAALFAVVGVMSMADDNDPPPDRPATDSYSNVEAQINCEHAIEARLVSPATADYTYTSQTRTGDGWELRGYVDSENRLGATVRSVFGCESQPAGTRVTELSGL